MITLKAKSSTSGLPDVDVKANPTTGAIYVESVAPDVGSASHLTNVKSTAYVASLILSTTPNTLFTLSITNSKATGQFIQLHNSATLPADAAVPEVPYYIGPLTSIVIDYGRYGRYFSTGIVVCNSSTGPTKTIGAADCWFDGQVI